MNDTSTKAPDETLREALAELVAVKDLKEQIESGYWSSSSDYEHAAAKAAYERRKPLAWEAARRALATPIKPGENP